MAIQFARIKMVSRKTGGNACRTSAYNARNKVVDEKTGEVFNFQSKGDNVYHEVLLPENADKKFKDISVLSNAVEKIEKKSNSQLLKEIVIALPDDKEFSLKDRINITHLIIEEMEWVKNGLAVQMDIHKPHDDDKNWHAHILVQTRRFTECGKELGKKARDLNPVFKTGKGKSFIVPEEDIIHEKGKRIINEYCKKMGYETRVDAIGKIAQEHIGPVRMRNIMNEAVLRNEMRKEANIKHLNSVQRVLDSVTQSVSVFNKADLNRVVKIIPDSELRKKLVGEVLNSKSLVSLYNDSGEETGYYTTAEIRAEENKLLRLSGYIAGSKNVISLGGAKATGITNHLIDMARKSLSEEQSIALSHLLLGKDGVRILRGRAGTGKSYVLGHVQKIATAAGINVIGLAPTHKARGELAKVGYEQNNTVKGMLFSLYNSRFELPKHSLLVIDEAGMIGNDDFNELLRVAATKKCNVILSGDEKQLASVQRGGMFEVFAERYGSTSMLNIQRQEDVWGRAVAMALSNGEVRSGVLILQEKNKIIESSTKDDSMQGLLADWNLSKEKLADKLIIAVKNKDVDALNRGARQYLKLSGELRGEEVSVGGNRYMKGDRILIKETSKELGLINGDFAMLLHASKERFVVIIEDVIGKDNLTADSTDIDKANDNSKIVEFNPASFSGFRHGYATTVFKAQGASIKDVYVFHNGFAGIRNSYVALSRNVKNLRLYINNQATKSIGHLVKQLGHDLEIGSSLSYLSKQDLENKKLDTKLEKEKSVLSGMLTNAVDFTKNKFTAFNDKHFADNAYYKYTPPKFEREEVEEVLNMVNEEMNQEAIGSNIILEEKAVVGGVSNISIKSIFDGNKPTGISKVKQSIKERFYAKVNHARNQVRNMQQKAQWDMEAERLRSEVKFKTEAIARDLLGEPNKNLSNGKTLRFGERGKIAVRISGGRMGSWFDFSSDKGGDMFALVQDRQGCDFKEAAEYLRQSVGMEASNNSYLKLVHDHKNKNLIEQQIKERRVDERQEKAKALQVEKLFSRGKEIGSKTVAYKYLTKHRAITCSVGDDIKTTGIYIRDNNSVDDKVIKGKYLPAIVAFARDSEGNVTGGQQIVLNKNTGAKADVAIPKKSFGKIAGSFVDVGRKESNQSNISLNEAPQKEATKKLNQITIIAEGLETALSIRQSLKQQNVINTKNIKVLCSLGISNIKNYQPISGERVILAADNDGIGSNTSKTIDNAKIALEGKGAFVEIVQPSKEGDFNDVLQSEGHQAISNNFIATLKKYTATTMQEYLQQDLKTENSLSDNDRANLLYIQKYQFPEKEIIDAYCKGAVHGSIVLDDTRKKLECPGKDLSFLIKYGVQAKDKLFSAIQNTQDIQLTVDSLNKECREYSQQVLGKDLDRAEFLYKYDKESEFQELFNNKKDKHQDILLYIEDHHTKKRFKQMGDRMAIYKIVDTHMSKTPELAIKFKLEAKNADKFGSCELSDLIKMSKEQGLEKALEHVNNNNKQYVLKSVEKQNIIGENPLLKGREYIEAIAKDKDIMQYIDQAVPDRKNDHLIDYINQRDINNIIIDLLGKNIENRFKNNATDLQSLCSSLQLQKGLEIYNNQGIGEFVKYTKETCSQNISKEISQNLIDIEKGRNIESFDGKEYQNKEEYISAIRDNKQIMQYIEAESQIGKEISQEQRIQTQEKESDKGGDFER